MNKNYNLNTVYTFFVFFYFAYCAKSLIFSMWIDEDSLLIIFKTSLNLMLMILSIGTLAFIKTKTKRLLFVVFYIFSISIILLGNKSFFNYIITISLLVLASQITWNRLIESVFFVYLLNIFLLILLSYFVNDFFLFDERFGYRFTAGFQNPNTFSLYLIIGYSISILYIERMNVTKGVLCVVSFGLYTILIHLIYLTYSRTGMALLTVCFIGHVCTLLFNNSRRLVRRKYLFYVSVIFVFVIAAIQFMSIVLFKSSRLIMDINHVLSGRVWHAYSLTQTLGYPTAFGVEIEQYLPIDFFFVNIIYSVGYVCFVLFVYVFMRKLYQAKTTLFMVVSLIVFILLTLTESYFSVLFYSSALFVIFHKDNHSSY